MLISRHRSIVGIIAVAAIVFAAEHVRETSFADAGGVIPTNMRAAAAAFWNDGDLSVESMKTFATLVSSIFLHGDPQHILWNMVFLWTFGILTSEILGQWRTLAAFLVTGVCGGILHVLLEPDSSAPMIGASGAVCGLEGVYLGLALRWQLPWAEVWPLAQPVQPLHLALFAVVGFVGDLMLLSNNSGHIAYGAHIGGFLSGLLIAAIVTTLYPTLYAYERSRRKDCI
jgi:membrane associated rhomboid family serine protease